VPDEPIVNDAKNANFCILYGLDHFSKLFTPRQMLCLLTFTAAVREAYQSMIGSASGLSQAGTGEPPLPPSQGVAPMDEERAKAVATYLGVLVNRQADYNASLARWHVTGEKIAGTFGRQALPMVWDFTELGPFGGASGSPEGALDWIVGVAEAQAESGQAGTVTRGSATALPYPDGTFDTVITDPPYYDNVPYADISDFFYVWLKRSIGHLYPEHFATGGTPKKQEAVADATRHGGHKQKAVRAYEAMMAQSLAEANRVLKPGGTLAVVYAHKTTLGWSTLVEAFRRAGFTVTEAWPLDTEMKSRLRGMDSAALASSIFLVGRKRTETAGVGNYEEQVQPALERIVRERVETLWDQGVSGADLVIACVGAGLRAFTRFARVEYANGEEVPAEGFLTEVEAVVLETLLEKIFGVSGGGVAAIDSASRFYVLWRFVYKASDIDAGEAIVFQYGQDVELEELASGKDALLEKKKGKYRLRDFTERGYEEDLGMPYQDGQPAPIIDALHRVLWLMENRPAELPEFLREAQPSREQMRLVAQALAGPGLKGGELADVSPSAELAALAKLTANWRSVVEDAVTTAAEREAKRTGQKTLDL
jgi:putative DNA methylase